MGHAPRRPVGVDALQRPPRAGRRAAPGHVRRRRLGVRRAPRAARSGRARRSSGASAARTSPRPARSRVVRDAQPLRADAPGTSRRATATAADRRRGRRAARDARRRHLPRPRRHARRTATTARSRRCGSQVWDRTAARAVGWTLRDDAAVRRARALRVRPARARGRHRPAALVRDRCPRRSLGRRPPRVDAARRHRAVHHAARRRVGGPVRLAEPRALDRRRRRPRAENRARRRAAAAGGRIAQARQVHGTRVVARATAGGGRGGRRPGDGRAGRRRAWCSPPTACRSRSWRPRASRCSTPAGAGWPTA